LQDQLPIVLERRLERRDRRPFLRRQRHVDVLPQREPIGFPFRGFIHRVQLIGPFDRARKDLRLTRRQQFIDARLILNLRVLAVLVARVEMADADRVRDSGADHRLERLRDLLADEFARREFVQGVVIFRPLRPTTFRTVLSRSVTWHR